LSISLVSRKNTLVFSPVDNLVPRAFSSSLAFKNTSLSGNNILKIAADVEIPEAVQNDVRHEADV